MKYMASHGGSGSRNPDNTVFGEAALPGPQNGLSSLAAVLADFELRLAAVGNIPYGVTEEMLTEIFSEVGPVKFFR